jgi:hypothetical protein
MTSKLLKLNDKIRIDNSWWNINKVIDYDANARKLTRVELISIDNEINFLPFMGPGGPIVPTAPSAIGPMQALAMSTINTTKMLASNVFSNQANAMVMGRGNTIVGGTRSVVVGDGYIVSENEMVTDNLRTASINGVATGTPALTYTANLTQAGIADPTAVVLNDTLGGVTWTRVTAGSYEGYLDAFLPGTIIATAFINNTVIICLPNLTLGESRVVYEPILNAVQVTTYDTGTGSAILSDSFLVDTTIEIKYYG